VPELRRRTGGTAATPRLASSASSGVDTTGPQGRWLHRERAVKIEVLEQGERIVIRRLTLAVGEAMPWHADACRRYSVVLSGDRLAIEYRSSGERIEFPVHRGLSGWDEPEPRVHRAVNPGDLPYEEIVTFLREHGDIEPQPSPT